MTTADEVRAGGETPGAVLCRLHALLTAGPWYQAELEMPLLLQLIVQVAAELVDADQGRLELPGHRPVDWPAGPDAGQIAMIDKANVVDVPVAGPAGDTGRLLLTKRTAPFTRADEQLLAVFGATAAMRLQHARLIESARVRSRWLEASARVNYELLANEDVEPLQVIVDSVKAITGADLVTVFLQVRGLDQARLAAMAGEQATTMAGLELDFNESLIGRVIRDGAPATFTDIRSHPDLARAAISMVPYGPGVVVPFVGPFGRAGALTIARRRGGPEFSALDAELAASFAAQAAITVGFNTARLDRARLKVVADRERIARDLHDRVIQQLFVTGLRLESDATHAPAEVRSQLQHRVLEINATIRQIRGTIFGLGEHDSGARPVDRIRQLVRDSADALGLQPALRLAGPVNEALTGELLHDCLAVIGESLSNVAKYARADRVELVVAVTESVVTIEVIDEGVGIDPAQVRRSGLQNLSERAELRAGSFELSSPGRPGGRGTRLCWSVPIGRARR